MNKTMTAAKTNFQLRSRRWGVSHLAPGPGPGCWPWGPCPASRDRRADQARTWARRCRSRGGLISPWYAPRAFYQAPGAASCRR